jgi:hypothetical protein
MFDGVHSQGNANQLHQTSKTDEAVDTAQVVVLRDDHQAIASPNRAYKH